HGQRRRSAVRHHTGYRSTVRQPPYTADTSPSAAVPVAGSPPWTATCGGR
ncbi:hypothetical protein A2U01_0087139, partial [Trifolium medium]|nr:hypothetical protein [Trifolium medium]